MLVAEIEGVKRSEVFLLNAKEVQYQFISFNTIVILLILESMLILSKLCFDSADQIADRA